jgi:NADPH-dependent curcumin reductase CurA
VPAAALDITAAARPAPVRKIAATSERNVSAMLYALGTPGVNANMAMKWVAQMPKPVDIADTTSHT